jgi:hypothetical protein
MADTTLTNEQMVAMIASLRAENAALAAKKERKLSFKVSEKGAVSVYGLSARFPTTLYKGQWDRLIAVIPELQAFMAANEAKLAVKPTAEVVVETIVKA